MIAAISLMRRRDDVPLAQFRRHWLDIHGPLVCSFAGLRRYVQCHVIASPVMNETAKAMRIDGFPILFFDNDDDRRLAQRSPAMAECNVDSRDFIGAVARAATDPATIAPPAGAGPISLLALYPEGREADLAPLRALPRLRGLMHYRVRSQGPAPNSTIPHLPVTIGAAVQAWFSSLVDLECAFAGWEDPSVGLFVVEEHWLV